MTFIIILWEFFIVLEAYRNYYLIEIKRQTPNRIVSALIRIAAALLLWLAAPSTIVRMALDQWWAIPIMEVFTFWWMFDTLLNIIRGRYFAYLGDGKWIDRIQKRTVGEYPAFFFKLVLAVASIILCFYGLNAVVRYQY